MSRFTQDEEPLGRFIDKETFQLAESMTYWIGGQEGSGVAVTVPAGFKTDFASVPKLILISHLLPKLDHHRRAAIIHDYLYSKHGLGRFDRLGCDKIFLEAMEVLGVGWFKRHVMYRGVRLGGWMAWNAHGKRIAEEKQLLDAAKCL